MTSSSDAASDAFYPMSDSQEPNHWPDFEDEEDRDELFARGIDYGPQFDEED